MCYPGGTAACWVTEGNEGVRVDGLPAGTQAIAYGDSYARKKGGWAKRDPYTCKDLVRIAIAFAAATRGAVRHEFVEL